MPTDFMANLACCAERMPLSSDGVADNIFSFSGVALIALALHRLCSTRGAHKMASFTGQEEGEFTSKSRYPSSGQEKAKTGQRSTGRTRLNSAELHLITRGR